MTDSATDSIDLAHAPERRIGSVVLRPPVRQLVHDDGRSEVLEPRVMQVLIALARADGGIVTRDELSRWCWENRIVGEDAINRVISRLRRTAEGIGAGSFRIETITKVGYRLLHVDAAADRPVVPPADAPVASRRGLLVGAGLASAAAIGGGAWVWQRRRSPAVSPQAAELQRQGMLALGQDTRSSQEQAIGLFQSAVAIQPDFADGWGALALTYGLLSHYRPAEEIASLRARAASAAASAERLDRGNAYAAVAHAWMLPIRGNWWPVEQALRRALADHPANGEIATDLAHVLNNVGRSTEACDLYERVRKAGAPNPALYFSSILALWGANRLDDADRLSDDAIKLYPSHFAIWFARVYIAMYSGRAADALAMIANHATRPSGIPIEEFDKVALVATALLSRAPADVDRAMTTWMARAHDGAGYAENSVQFACALGRLDEAFAIADAYFFGRGFVVPQIRFSQEQGTYTPQPERLTHFLFNPVTIVMRRDRRFGPLVAEIGLEKYWREAGAQPDYRRRA